MAELNLTSRAIAIGAGVGVLMLAGATLGAHIVLASQGIDDGGVVAAAFQSTVGAFTLALGAVVTFLFGGNRGDGSPPQTRA